MGLKERIAAIKEISESELVTGERVLNHFIGIKNARFFLYFLIGPLAALSTKQFIVAITDKGIHFHKLSRTGKSIHHDFFRFSEISKVKIKKGLINNVLKIQFSNGRKLKLHTPKKGLKDVPILTEIGKDKLLACRSAV